MLDYKIKELKREIGPRETLIQELNEQTTKMRQEEKFFSRMKDNLDLIRKDLSLKQDGLSIEGKKLATIIKQQEEEKTEFREAIFNCLKNLGDYKKLKQGIVDLHKVYVSAKESEDDFEIRKKAAEQRRKNLEEEGRLKKDDDQTRKSVEPRRKAGQQIGDADEHRKQSEQRKQKEISLANYRDLLLKDQASYKQEQSLIMKENVQLLQDINDLKKQQHELEIGRAEIKKQMEQLYRQAQQPYDQDQDAETQELLDELSNLQHRIAEMRQLKAQAREFYPGEPGRQESYPQRQWEEADGEQKAPTPQVVAVEGEEN